MSRELIGGGKPVRSHLYGLVSDDEPRPIRADSVTHTIQEIDHVHSNIHSGKHFYVSGFSTGLGDTDVIEFYIVTPDTTKWTHMSFDIIGSGQTAIFVQEGASIPTGGTTVIPLNSNRNSTKESVLRVILDATATDTGTVIEAIYLGGNVDKKQVSGGGVSREDEIVMKQNTVYVYRIESRTTGNNIDYRGNWYEHTNKD